jgi:hypothetical protein
MADSGQQAVAFHPLIAKNRPLTDALFVLTEKG